MTTTFIVRSFALIATVALASCGEHKKETPAENVPLVEVIQVKSLQPSLNIVLPGELKPWNKVHVFPKVKGYIGRVLADRGTLVKEGQVLAVLEAPELLATLNQAKAQVSSAEAAVIEQHAKQKASKTTYRRILETSKTQGAVSANELEVAFARMMSDSALARAAEENFHAAQAQLASQTQFVSYLTVRAPFDGTITERNVSPGELVGPDGNAKPMFILEDRSRLRLTIAVPENLSNSITDKSEVFFTTQADPLKEYKATFARSSNTLQENNRTMIAEFDFVNDHGDLKAGMYAEVRLPIMRNKPTLFVPSTSVLHSTEGVFLVKVNNNVAEWVSIQKGNSLDSLVEVFGAIHEGDKVIKKAYDELRNGQALKVKS